MNCVIFCVFKVTVIFLEIETMDDSIKIERLQESSQWATWRFQVKISAIAGDYFDVITGDEERPTTAEKLALWKKKDAKGQKLIGTSVGQTVMIHIINCKSAKEMWDKLHSVFEQKSQTGIHLLQQKFFTYTKDPSDKMASHISKLEEIAHQLNDLEVNIAESMLITKIIMTLPPEYNHFSSVGINIKRKSNFG